jgi:hypothetical protein
MRRKIGLSGAVAAAIAAFAFAPGSAQAHDIVSVKDSYGPGTIVIRTGERRLYYFVGGDLGPPVLDGIVRAKAGTR